MKRRQRKKEVKKKVGPWGPGYLKRIMRFLPHRRDRPAAYSRIAHAAEKSGVFADMRKASGA